MIDVVQTHRLPSFSFRSHVVDALCTRGARTLARRMDEWADGGMHERMLKLRVEYSTFGLLSTNVRNVEGER